MIFRGGNGQRLATFRKLFIYILYFLARIYTHILYYTIHIIYLLS
nr:MAG TPA: hypothetical protein [Bacteriophage sp.]